MNYPVELLLTRADCTAVLNDTREDIDRVEFHIRALTRSNDLQSDDSAENVAEIAGLLADIPPLETRIAGMAPGDLRHKKEKELHTMQARLVKLQDEQKGRGGRGLFRRRRELDAAQRELVGHQDCLTQVQARHDALPA